MSPLESVTPVHASGVESGTQAPSGAVPLAVVFCPLANSMVQVYCLELSPLPGAAMAAPARVRMARGAVNFMLIVVVNENCLWSEDEGFVWSAVIKY